MEKQPYSDASNLEKIRHLRQSVPSVHESMSEADTSISNARSEWDRRIDQPGSDDTMRGTTSDSL